jgi:hypothetical protein
MSACSFTSSARTYFETPVLVDNTGAETAGEAA